jgi:Lhr-like helicases
MSGTAFERYAPFIQEYIYRKRWTDLREVQTEACSAILDTDDHVIIASGTASGKTEAAFFPILTTLYHHPSNSVGVLYIGPLKALINDQFERLSGLLEDSGIPVWPWHGDVSQSMPPLIMTFTPLSARKLGRNPGLWPGLSTDSSFVILLFSTSYSIKLTQ